MKKSLKLSNKGLEESIREKERLNGAIAEIVRQFEGQCKEMNLVAEKATSDGMIELKSQIY